MPWFNRWRRLRRIREWPRIVDFFGGPEAFRTQDLTMPASALPEGLAGIRDHESARTFVARHYPNSPGCPAPGFARSAAAPAAHAS